ncbi:hypothetical protein [Sphingomonas aquatica]|uniref:hypothetical protein n=1 Tax=Sphingomonas aquatica TaxID=1763824 RepID=UPI00301D2735
MPKVGQNEITAFARASSRVGQKRTITAEKQKAAIKAAKKNSIIVEEAARLHIVKSCEPAIPERLRWSSMTHRIFHRVRTFPCARGMISFQRLAMHGHERVHARAKSTATHISCSRPS